MMPRIDAHLHVFARASAEFPRETSALFPADREAPVETLLVEMEAHRIHQAVLVQLGGTNTEHHAYLLHCLKAYPDRFLGIGLIPPDTPDPETHMDRLAHATGVIGFRLTSIGGPRDPFARIDVRDFETYRIWKRAAENDYVLWLYPQAIDAHLIPYLLEAFPQVRVVVNHLGICPGEGKFSWDTKGRPQVETPMYNPAFHTTYRLARYENVTVHLSGQYAFSKEAFPYRDLARWHERLLSNYGAKRLMWATDFPWILEDPGYGPLTDIIKELLPDLSTDEYHDIMGRTAKTFLRFPNRTAG
ncbi:MAG: amidohydrolase family protein [Candidatus Poribacteria bacterium]|nr:amidohydrolase family protein [Candidatus Poribacteria bacterium]